MLGGYDENICYEINKKTHIADNNNLILEPVLQVGTM